MDYDITKYDRPSVAADIAVFTVRKSSSESYRHLSKPVLSVLLIKRTEEPFDSAAVRKLSRRLHSAS